MKKAIGIIALITATMMLTGCFTLFSLGGQKEVTVAVADGQNRDEIYNSTFMPTKQSKLKKICETYTPKNSVLVYGSCNTFKKGIFSMPTP